MSVKHRFKPGVDRSDAAGGLPKNSYCTPAACLDSAIKAFWLLHRVKRRIGFAQQLLNRIPISWIDGNAHADGKPWSIAVIGNAFADFVGPPVGLSVRWFPVRQPANSSPPKRAGVSMSRQQELKNICQPA